MKRLLPMVFVIGALAATSCTLIVNPWRPGSATRPWYCDPTDTAINDGHDHGHGGHTGHMDPFAMAYPDEKGPLSAADCQSVTFDITTAKTFASQYPTVADAEAAGWRQATIWTDGQGYHYVDPSRLTGPFDPTKPNWLMYDNTSPDGQLTGMMFLTNSGAMPPDGFDGGNDHWHQHGELCTDPAAGAYPFIIGEHITDAECTALGGTNILYGDVWMVHVWLPQYDGWTATDIFNKSHPSVTTEPGHGHGGDGHHGG